jgi:hypothetical protein
VTSRGARAARGAAIAAFAAFVAALAHTVGGGATPGPMALVVAIGFATPLAVLVTGPRARLLRTTVAAGIAQASLHLCYALGGAAPATTASADASGAHAGHAASVQLDALAGAAVVDHGHALMPVAHLVAAVLTVAALALADRVVDAVGRTVRLIVRRLTTIPAPVHFVAVRVRIADAGAALVPVLFHAVAWSRGPPVVIAAS